MKTDTPNNLDISFKKEFSIDIKDNAITIDELRVLREKYEQEKDTTLVKNKKEIKEFFKTVTDKMFYGGFEIKNIEKDLKFLEYLGYETAQLKNRSTDGAPGVIFKNEKGELVFAKSKWHYTKMLKATGSINLDSPKDIKSKTDLEKSLGLEVDEYPTKTSIEANFNGKATINDKNGFYQGEFKNGKRDGKGTCVWLNSDKYVGEFKNGKMDGSGAYTWITGDKYIGEYKDNNFNGQGTFIWKDGSKYKGEYKNGKREGKGIYTNKNKVEFNGVWANDLFTGKINNLSYKNTNIKELDNILKVSAAITYVAPNVKYTVPPIKEELQKGKGDKEKKDEKIEPKPAPVIEKLVVEKKDLNIALETSVGIMNKYKTKQVTDPRTPDFIASESAFEEANVKLLKEWNKLWENMSDEEKSKNSKLKSLYDELEDKTLRFDSDQKYSKLDPTQKYSKIIDTSGAVAIIEKINIENQKK